MASFNQLNPVVMGDYELREQDKWLPIANVCRIMKNALPGNAKISKEAKECMQECISEFVSFITSEASEKCCRERRKTVNGEDILFAMMSLGFENYAEVLKIYLAKYRVSQNLKQQQIAAHRRTVRQMNKQEILSASASASASGGSSEEESFNEYTNDDNDETTTTLDNTRYYQQAPKNTPTMVEGELNKAQYISHY